VDAGPSVATGVLALSIVLSVNALASEFWPRFRGPNGSGVSESGRLPTEFGLKTNLAWKTTVPTGSSSPIVAATRVFLTGYEGDRLLVRCLDLNNGQSVWERAVHAARTEKKSSPNDPASSTPVSDGRALYVLFSAFGLVAYAANDGRELWRQPFAPFTQPHGMASSPILAGDVLIVVADQVGGSWVAAFDTTTGQQKWKTARPDFVGGYATPVMRNTTLLVSGPAELTAYSASNGERLWSAPQMGIMPVASPVCYEDRVFVNNDAVPPFESLANQMKADRNGDGRITPEEFPDPSFKEAVLAIDRAYGNGDGAVDKTEWDGALKLMRTLNALVAIQIKGDKPKELWRITKKLGDAASPLLYQSVLYLVRDGGILTSIDPETGHVLRQERLPGVQGRIFASPVAAERKLYVLSEVGKMAVVKAGRNWDVLAVNDLNENCYATPALVEGMILVRSRHSLWAFRNKE
jgi:outer membrane protein assembly factor BamB